MSNLKRKMIIYPYDLESSTIVRHSDFINEYEIVGLVSPAGWLLNDKDTCSSDGEDNLGITIYNSFDNIFDKCDTICFVESIIGLDFIDVILPNIKKAIDANKDIICLIRLDELNRKEIELECNAKGITFTYYNNSNDENINGDYETNKLFDIETPIIFVMGVGEQMQKFEIQLALRENIQKSGYKISQIGSRHYCEFLGFHSFPYFMFCESVTESNKIFMFNHYVKKIEIVEEPDIIIIGIPGGVMKYNSQFTNRFGITAYEVAQGVIPDIAILSVNYEEYEYENFEKLGECFKYKLGCEIDCFNLTNKKIDWSVSKKFNSLTYLTLESEYIDGKKEKYKGLFAPVYNILNPNDASCMANTILDKFENSIILI